jgi:hypothetical protein
MREAGKIFDVPVLYHVVIGSSIDDPLGKGFCSSREAALL